MLTWFRQLSVISKRLPNASYAASRQELVRQALHESQ
jgi:hypothetical protein